MKWPYTRRVSPGTALAVIGLGIAVAAVLIPTFESLQGTRKGYCWWWPTGWMTVPTVLIGLGLILLVVPVLRAEPDPPSSSRGFRVGEGLPGWEGPFQRAVNELRRDGAQRADGSRRPVSIRDPRGPGYGEGPGVVQDFDSLDSEFGWALCALPNQPVVAVAGEIWTALLALGPTVGFAHPLEALGYPVPGEKATRCIESDATRLELAGGAWRGVLVREAVGRPWQWEPTPRPSTEVIREKDYWSRDAGQRLRMRLVAALPWRDADDLEITAQRRADLEAWLASSAVSGYLKTLFTDRKAEFPEVSWPTGLQLNTTDRLAYLCFITAPDGTWLASAEVMLGLPNASSRSVVVCIELSVYNLDAWHTLIPTGETAPGDLRLHPAEAAEFFATAARDAAWILPLTLGEPVPSRYFSPPRLQLVLATDRPRHDAPYPPLRDYLDIEPLGRAGSAVDTIELSASTTAAPAADVEAGGRITLDALVHAAGRFGFIDATDRSFTRSNS